MKYVIYLKLRNNISQAEIWQHSECAWFITSSFASFPPPSLHMCSWDLEADSWFRMPLITIRCNIWMLSQVAVYTLQTALSAKNKLQFVKALQFRYHTKTWLVCHCALPKPGIFHLGSEHDMEVVCELMNKQGKLLPWTFVCVAWIQLEDTVCCETC